MEARSYTSISAVAGARFPAAGFARMTDVLGLRHTPDFWLIFATLAFAVAILVWRSWFAIGVGIWWLLNTVSHNFIHQPFFRSRTANRFFALYLSVLTLVPHRLWRDRHLAHHADRVWSFRFSYELLLQSILVTLCWVIAVIVDVQFALRSLVPGFGLAMMLCWLHGYFEHTSGTTSHYSSVYNRLFFNDGFHVEHHERPSLHWNDLPRFRQNSKSSRWPAILRWCDWLNLNALECIAARSPMLQHWVVRTHERAVRKLTAGLPAPKRVTIVGGALFPRTALVVHALWPAAEVTIIDSSSKHLDLCRAWLRGDETLSCAHVRADSIPEADIIFVPLAFDQDKQPLYKTPKHGSVIVHDWIWNRATGGRIVRSAIASVFLLKRLNLVTR
jgi:hypothetical protein